MSKCEHCWVALEDTDVTIRLHADETGWNHAILICEYCEVEYEYLEVVDW